MLINQATFNPSHSSGFLVIDGVNGAGKSTLQARISEYLIERGRQTVVTREPGATPLGRRLRSILLEAEREEMSDLAELFLFAADRSEHVERVIKPALAAGQIVVCDRYYYSTEAFQGYGRGLNLDDLRMINKLAIGGVVPDLVLLLDLDPVAGLKRTRKRANNAAAGDAFESEHITFHQRIREGFLTIAANATEPFAIIDASLPQESVLQHAISLIDKLYL